MLCFDTASFVQRYPGIQRRWKVENIMLLDRCVIYTSMHRSWYSTVRPKKQWCYSPMGHGIITSRWVYNGRWLGVTCLSNKHTVFITTDRDNGKVFVELLSYTKLCDIRKLSWICSFNLILGFELQFNRVSDRCYIDEALCWAHFRFSFWKYSFIRCREKRAINQKRKLIQVLGPTANCSRCLAKLRRIFLHKPLARP